jgi:hypothetical protein
MTLNLGGDDITEVFYVLLQQSCFPYKEMDLTRLYDWNLMQDLKHQFCTFIIVSRVAASLIRNKSLLHRTYLELDHMTLLCGDQTLLLNDINTRCTMSTWRHPV